MKKFFMGILLLVGFLSSSSQDTKSDDLIKLKALNATFIHNFVTNDTISHSKIIHPRFVCITSEGRTIGRAEYMNNWLRGFDGYMYWDYRNEDISIFGDMALVHAQNKYVIVKDGKEISGMSMYTDTYIKENGEWKCVQAQLSRVAPQYFGGDETIFRKYDYRRK